MFDFVHLKQEEGWQLKKAIIVTQTNFFSVQQEYIGIITPSDRINETI